MKPFRVLTPLIAGLSLASMPLLSQANTINPQQVRYLAANCANCHGTSGKAEPGMPMLAGLDRQHFIKQMRAFRDGTRPATIMHQLAKGYTDEQIVALADYFSRQKRPQ
jgi:cytochrome c553